MGRGKEDRDARSVLLGRNRMRPVVDQEWFDTSEYIRTTLAGYPFLRASGNRVKKILILSRTTFVLI